MSNLALSSEAFSSHRLVVLPGSVPAASVADACRGTVIEFLRGSRYRMGKAGLVEWLLGPYRQCTRYADHLTLPGSSAPRGSRALRSERIEAVIRRARRSLLTAVRALVVQGKAELVTAAAAGGAIARCADAAGNEGWVPVHHGRMLLAERVGSLLAVDYLSRPADYWQSAGVCKRCGVLSFDPGVRSSGLCAEDAILVRRRARVKIAV
jgi:hypothetical protein